MQTIYHERARELASRLAWFHEHGLTHGCPEYDHLVGDYRAACYMRDHEGEPIESNLYDIMKRRNDND